MTGAVTQVFREPSDLQGSDLKTYKMIPYRNLASKNQWDRERQTDREGFGEEAELGSAG